MSREFDLQKLKTAAVYIERMAEGRNPANNQPVDDEILNNPNVIRCLHFVGDVLREVQDNHGLVGKKYVREKEDFPEEILQQFAYRHDKPISHLLRQIAEPAEGRNIRMPSAAAVNKWLAANGYLEKVTLPESGKESWQPTAEGQAAGIYTVRNGEPGFEYYSVMYTEAGQMFLVSHFPAILAETAKQAKEAEKTRQAE